MSGASRPLDVLGIRSARGVTGRFAQLFPADVRGQLVRIDVRPDGHCGAYVLSIVNFALTRELVPQARIRDSVHRLACRVAKGAFAAPLAREFAHTMRAIARSAYLNDTELVLFLHARRLHAHILTHTRGRLVVQSHPCRDGAVGHVFLLFSHGCHWQLLARSAKGEAARGFSPVWTLRAGAQLFRRMLLSGATVHDGAPPERSYTAVIDGTPLFRIDARDRVWVVGG